MAFSFHFLVLTCFLFFFFFFISGASATAAAARNGAPSSDISFAFEEGADEEAAKSSGSGPG